MTLLVDAPTLITGEELAEMSLAGSYELVKGRIVEMSPPGFTYGKIGGASIRLWPILLILMI
jgi:hypothetical protein